MDRQPANSTSNGVFRSTSKGAIADALFQVGDLALDVGDDGLCAIQFAQLDLQRLLGGLGALGLELFLGLLADGLGGDVGDVAHLLLHVTVMVMKGLVKMCHQRRRVMRCFS